MVPFSFATRKTHANDRKQECAVDWSARFAIDDCAVGTVEHMEQPLRLPICSATHAITRELGPAGRADNLNTDTERA
jgi:hypothetical protein